MGLARLSVYVFLQSLSVSSKKDSRDEEAERGRDLGGGLRDRCAADRRLLHADDAESRRHEDTGHHGAPPSRTLRGRLATVDARVTT